MRLSRGGSAAPRLRLKIQMTAPFCKPRHLPGAAPFVDRGLRYSPARLAMPRLSRPERPPLVLLHGWMDVAASFQFMVDALEAELVRDFTADWRGFGLTERPAATATGSPTTSATSTPCSTTPSSDPDSRSTCSATSMGGNVVMLYAGIRPGASAG